MKLSNLLHKALLTFLVLTAVPVVAAAAGFKVRAFHLDMRSQVMTLQALKSLTTDLSRRGINMVIMEYEATFPFDDNATLRNPYAFSRHDVRELVAHCRRLGIDLVPLQNCFGHCAYILRHPRYAALREAEWDISQVCPSRLKAATTVFTSIFKEIAALHPSPYIHIGCDETLLLGHCRECRKSDPAKLFADYVNAMCRIVHSLGKRPIIWADIARKYPQVVDRLPRDLIYVDWNYGSDMKDFEKIARLRDRGATVWAATAMRSHPDNLQITDWNGHFGNLNRYIPYARRHGYEGIVETSWSTGGTYGFHYDFDGSVIYLSMQPIRQVYPMQGFQILTEAFCQAVSDTAALDADRFILDYATAHFGFTPREARDFRSYLRTPQAPLPPDLDVEKVGRMLREARDMGLRLDSLRPKRNKREFSHFVMMNAIRCNYLEFKLIQAESQSPGYRPSQAGPLLSRLRRVMRHYRRVASQFRTLNDGYLKRGQADEIFRVMYEPFEWLEATLKTQIAQTEPSS